PSRSGSLSLPLHPDGQAVHALLRIATEQLLASRTRREVESSLEGWGRPQPGQWKSDGLKGGRLMLRMLGNPRRFCDGLTRREALAAGALTTLGGAFNLPSLLALEQSRPASARPGKAKSVLMLYLHGGAPTQDMFDMKPAAPVEVRGEFKPISSNV